MAKRSPILGYNHNVRYRGIVFHVQTEDSGIINPHVFSHLFHGGVILSSRKLRVAVKIIPTALGREVELTIGFLNPALQQVA